MDLSSFFSPYISSSPSWSAPKGWGTLLSCKFTFGSIGFIEFLVALCKLQPFPTFLSWAYTIPCTINAALFTFYHWSAFCISTMFSLRWVSKNYWQYLWCGRPINLMHSSSTKFIVQQMGLWALTKWFSGITESPYPIRTAVGLEDWSAKSGSIISRPEFRQMTLTKLRVRQRNNAV